MCGTDVGYTLLALHVAGLVFIISTLFLCFFISMPYMQRFFTQKKLFTLVSFIFCVPQAKTFVMDDNMAGQFNTTALVVNYVCFFMVPHASCFLLRPMTNFLYCVNIVRRMTQAVSLKART